MSDSNNGAVTISDEPNNVAEPDVTHRVANANPRPWSAGRVPTQAPTPPRRRGADHYDTILWRVHPQKNASHDLGFCLGVTSCGRQAGVSTVAANVAIRAADHRLGPVLLVDANLVEPSLQRSFRLEGQPGLLEVLSGGCELADAIHQTQVTGLSVMPMGAPGLVDRTPCDYDSLHALLTELRGEYATIVFDLPEVSRLRHMLLVAQQLDSTLFILRSEHTRRKVAQAAINRLTDDGVTVAGTIITQHKNYVPSWIRRPS